MVLYRRWRMYVVITVQYNKTAHSSRLEERESSSSQHGTCIMSLFISQRMNVTLFPYCLGSWNKPPASPSPLAFLIPMSHNYSLTAVKPATSLAEAAGPELGG